MNTRPARVWCVEHLGTATQPCHVSTRKPVVSHFRLPGHSHSELVFLSIERVMNKDQFWAEAREAFWIKKYHCLKLQPLEIVEHGMNLEL